jgi:vitamin B12 transporter
MSAYGGPGQPGSVFIRGANSNQTLLLIDGVRYGSATTGAPVWENIPLDLIERIEIVKGPASALYGSDGVGGVVQVFTRKGARGGAPFMPRASVTLGSERYGQAAGGFSGASGAATYALDVQRTTVRGFSATNERADGSFFQSFHPDRDPFQQSAVNASFGYQLTPDWRLDTGLLHSEGVNHYDDGPGRDAHRTVRTQTAYLGASGKLMDHWRTQLRVARSDDQSRDVVAAFPARFQTIQNQYLWQNDITTPVGMVIAGLERLEQRVDSDTAYAVTRRDIDSAFAGLNGDAGPHSWQLNARQDRNSQFGSHATWFAGYGYRITPNWRANISHGTSFVAPSFNDLYYPFFSNPDLKPQKGRNTDVGITWSEGGHSVKLVGYDNRLTNLITYDMNFQPQNTARAHIRGATLRYDGQFGNVGLHASYDALNPRDEDTGEQLLRRARSQATLGADYRVGAWTFGGSALYAGRRNDVNSDGGRVQLASYTTVDLHAQYRVNKDWSVQGRIVNVTDVKYETVWGYNQPRRGFYVTLRWQPR